MGLYTYKICISLKFLFPFRCLLVTFCIIKYRRGGKQMAPCLAYMINITNPLMFNRTGKFEALSSKWTHSVQTTEDYELIVETKGNLYLQYQDVKYTVTPGQYLLLQPPSPKPSNEKRIRRGYRESECSFYWLHFHANVLFLYPDWFPIKLMEDVMISSCQFKNHCFILKESFFL